MIEGGNRRGIECYCVFLGVGKRDPDPKLENLKIHNNDVLEALAAHPDRLFGFALNPNCLEQSVAELERCVADGPMTGIKFLAACKYSDPRIDPIIQRAASLGAVISQHA